MLSAKIIPSLSNSLNACSKKNGYFPFEASIKIKSYLLLKVGKISTASPTMIFILSSNRRNF